ncbi:MAG: Spc97/Spc98 family protein [Akkermansiaceae bacterium]|nr:Spc97/Spc98 family protein [Akkermansiaceae bacterium]
MEFDPAGRFMQQIQQHYERASTALLTMMLSHFQLKGWLESCKNFFLLHQGDYLTNFLDCADSELDKEVSKASMSLLRGQLEMAVKTSSLAHDTHSDKLQFVLDPNSFTDLHSVCPLPIFLSP